MRQGAIGLGGVAQGGGRHRASQQALPAAWEADIMETFAMLIMLLHLDFTGRPYTTTMTEDPQTEYPTLALCESAALIKRESMLRSSSNYPDLGIIDIKITCVPSEFLGTDQDNPSI